MEKFFPRIPILGALLVFMAATWPGIIGHPGTAQRSAVGMVAGENPQPAAGHQAAQLAELKQHLQALNSPCYETRNLSAQQLERWLGMPEMAAMLAEQFQQLIVQPELPCEVRWRISLWRTRLPSAKSEPPQAVPLEELQRLVRQLDDDSYAIRVGACQRLQWMAASPHLAKPIILLLKRRLADPSLCEETYRRVESVRNIAWGMCLGSDAPAWDLPPVSDAQIGAWLDELAQPATKRDPRAATGRRIARQELMDALSQDRDVPRLKAAVEARLRGKLDAEAAARLRELLDLTQPALVAECWSGRALSFEQHLVVGQPMQVPGAAHPTHFDRADDRKAHCVSGNSLLPGEYPVGVAFPAPRWTSPQEAVFHLVNLPTPRRQIAYSYYVKTDPAARLATLSRRTLDRFLSDKTLLDDSELGMLGQLDAREVSRFASRYFQAMDDSMVEEDFNQETSTSRSHLGRQSSRFGAICAQLALDGTREAVPGLLQAVRQKKFLPPTPLGLYRLQWLAALSIARRDPWPEADSWLGANIDNRQTVLSGRDEAAEIGATAAGVLLTRHGERPEAFALQAAVDSELVRLGLPGFRYATPDGVQRVRQWWKRQHDK